MSEKWISWTLWLSAAVDTVVLAINRRSSFLLIYRVEHIMSYRTISSKHFQICPTPMSPGEDQSIRNIHEARVMTHGGGQRSIECRVWRNLAR